MGKSYKKRALVTGIANDDSIAYSIVEWMIINGIDVTCTTSPGLMDRARKALDKLDPDIPLWPCDVESDADIAALAKTVKRQWRAGFDYLVHAIAYSDRNELKGSILNTSRANFRKTMEISAFSLTALVAALHTQIRNNGAVTCLTFAASRFRSENYNVMAYAKAALETSVLYLAHDPAIGPRGIRVTAISAGPIKTLSSMGVGGFKRSLRMGRLRSATRENVTADDVAQATINVLKSPGITATTINVDNGIAAIGMGASDAEYAFHGQHE